MTSADDAIFAAVAQLDVDLMTPARRDPMGARSGLPSVVATPGGPVRDGRVGVFPVHSGAVSGFSMPVAPGVPRFDTEPLPPPPPPVPRPGQPFPYPPIRLGEGPVYDPLIGPKSP